MVFENKLDNIFTDYDESIFSDGSIVPIGFRVILTSLGSKIFFNRISADIRYYTINLFHHYLLHEGKVEWGDKINMLVRKQTYNDCGTGKLKYYINGELPEFRKLVKSK